VLQPADRTAPASHGAAEDHGADHRADSAPDSAARPSPAARFGRRLAALLAFGLGLFGLLLGVGFLLVRTPFGADVGRADLDALHWLGAQRTPGLDAVTNVASDLASTTVVLVAGLVVAVAAALRLRHWWPFALMAVALLGELALFLNSAIIVGRPRPPVEHLDGALPPTSSFPSGHTAAAVCLYGGLAAIVLLVTRAWWRWLLLAVAVLVVVGVAFARVYRGAHNPSDVLGGLMLAVPWLLGTTWAVRTAVPRGGAARRGSGG
jgi:undecaprenyl-diphosphatase